MNNPWEKIDLTKIGNQNNLINSRQGAGMC
jgi:hypothetical protein